MDLQFLLLFATMLGAFGFLFKRIKEIQNDKNILRMHSERLLRIFEDLQQHQIEFNHKIECMKKESDLKFEDFFIQVVKNKRTVI